MQLLKADEVLPLAEDGLFQPDDGGQHLTPVNALMLWLGIELLESGYVADETVTELRSLRQQVAARLGGALDGPGALDDLDWVAVFFPPDRDELRRRVGRSPPRLILRSDLSSLCDGDDGPFIGLAAGKIANRISVGLLILDPDDD